MENDNRLEIREEVLNYMRELGTRLKSDLDEGELAYAKIIEDPILVDRVRGVEINSSNALKYYQEMESYYDKYVNSETRSKLVIDDSLNNLKKIFLNYLVARELVLG